MQASKHVHHVTGVYELVLQGDLAHLQKVNTLTSGELLIVSAV